jgi:hypothetical protein
MGSSANQAGRVGGPVGDAVLGASDAVEEGGADPRLSCRHIALPRIVALAKVVVTVS